MAHRKKLLLVGDSIKLKEFASAFAAAGTAAELAETDDAALNYLKNEIDLPDGIVFIVPVYWETIEGFMAQLRADQRLAGLKVIYLGDFIEANDQIMLKRAGVYTLTLGPVPPEEAVRFILKLIYEGSYHVFDGHTQLPGHA